MTCMDYIDKELRRSELSLRRAMRKPNTPAEELSGLRRKIEVLSELKSIVAEHFKRIHT